MIIGNFINCDTEASYSLVKIILYRNGEETSRGRKRSMKRASDSLCGRTLQHMADLESAVGSLKFHKGNGNSVVRIVPEKKFYNEIQTITVIRKYEWL